MHLLVHQNPIPENLFGESIWSSQRGVLSIWIEVDIHEAALLVLPMLPMFAMLAMSAGLVRYYLVAGMIGMPIGFSLRRTDFSLAFCYVGVGVIPLVLLSGSAFWLFVKFFIRWDVQRPTQATKVGFGSDA